MWRLFFLFVLLILGSLSGLLNSCAVPPVQDDEITEAPYLSYGYWRPKAFQWFDGCSSIPCTYLHWSVCDIDNNLEGGEVRIYDAGTNNLFTGQTYDWEEFFAYEEKDPDVSDCDHPWETKVGVVFDNPTEPGYYVYDVDIEVTDAKGNVSKRLSNLRVTYSYSL